MQVGVLAAACGANRRRLRHGEGVPKRRYPFDPEQEPRLVPAPEPMPEVPRLITELAAKAYAEGAAAHAANWLVEIGHEVRDFPAFCAEAGITHVPDPRLPEVAEAFKTRPTIYKATPSPVTQERRQRAVRRVLKAALPELMVLDPFDHRFDVVAAGEDLPVHQRVKSFRPQIEPVAWARVRPLFEQIVVSALTANPGIDYRRTTTPTAQLLVFCTEIGVPLEPAAVLDPHVVDRFLRHRDASGGSNGAYRSTLGMIQRALFPRPVRPTLPRNSLGPYTPGEVESLWRWVASIPRHKAFSALREVMVFTLGAGLDMPPLRDLRGTHVSRAGVDVIVDAPGRSYPFPILAEWADEAIAAAERAGADFLIHPTQKARDGASLLNNLTNDAGRRPPRTPRFDARRFRATWLVRQLQRGTPAPVLLAASGLKTLSALDRLMPYVEMWPEADAFRFLRGEG